MIDRPSSVRTSPPSRSKGEPARVWKICTDRNAGGRGAINQALLVREIGGKAFRTPVGHVGETILDIDDDQGGVGMGHFLLLDLQLIAPF